MQEKFNGEQYRENVKAAIERFYKERAQEGRTTQQERRIFRQLRRGEGDYSCSDPANRPYDYGPKTIERHVSNDARLVQDQSNS